MKPKLTNEEKKILNDFEKGRYQSVKNKKDEVLRFFSYARSHFQKDKRVNIRISSHDLTSIQEIATREGMPYQTLMSSILHMFASGFLRRQSRT